MKPKDYKMSLELNPSLFGNLLKYLKPKNGEKILDLGCARGFYVKKLENYTDEILGVDACSNFIKKRVTPRVKYGDVTNLDFKDNSFDKIYSMHVAEHIADLEKFFSEAARILRPGGVAVLVYPWEPFRGFQAIFPAARIYKNPFMARKIHLHKLTPKKIKKLIEPVPFRHLNSKFVFALGFHYFTVLIKTPVS